MIESHAFSDIYLLIYFDRLVTSDVMFYTECLQSLNGLGGLVNTMDDIWDR